MQRKHGSSCGLTTIVALVGILSGCAKETPPQPEPVTKEAAPAVVVTTPPTNAPANPVPVPPRPGAAETATAPANPQAPTAEATAPKVVPNAAPNPASTVAPVVTVPPEPVALPVPVPPLPAITTPQAPEAPIVPPPPPVESPKQSAQAFSVWLQSSGKYSAGQQGTVEAVVVPKAEFHCNADYPYKFVTSAAAAGVTYPKPTVRSDGLSVSTSRAVMRIPFVPQNAGDTKVGGTFHFSVCSDSQCVVEKRDVYVTVKVQ